MAELPGFVRDDVAEANANAQRPANAGDVDGAQRGRILEEADISFSDTTDEEDCYEEALPLSFVIDHIETKVMKRDLYCDLFVYIPFVIMFSFFAFGERDITGSYYTSRVTRDVVLGAEISGFEFIKTYENIVDIDDWYKWMRSVLVPALYPELPPVNGTTTLQSTNYILGAVRIRTIRASNKSCDIEAGLYAPPFADVESDVVEDYYSCYGSHRGGGEETHSRFNFPNPLIPQSANITVQSQLLYNHFDCSDIPGGQYIIGLVTFYHCGGYVVDVPLTRTQDDVLRLLDKFQDPRTPYLDERQTRLISTEFFMYTPSTNTFTSTKLFVEVAPGGTFLPQYQLRAFMIWTTDRSEWQTVYDFFFLLYVLYYVYRFVREWIMHYKTKKKILNFIFSVWNAMEFVNLAVFFAVFTFRWIWWDVSKQSRYTKFPYAPRYPEDLDNLLTMWSTMVYLNVCNCLTVFLKILKYLQLNPRLGVLTLSISEKKSQLLGVLALFSWAIFTFAMAGYSMFGSTMYEYHTLATAYTTLVRMLVGDFSRFQSDLGIYEGMRKENRLLAGVFFWCYVVLVFYTLLNMVIAVLAEGFSVVNARSAETTFAEEVRSGLRSLCQMLHPSRLRMALKLAVAGSSVDECLRLTLVNIAEHKELVKGENVDADEDLILLDLRRFHSYIGRDLSERLGEGFIKQMWERMQESFQQLAETPEVCAPCFFIT